MISNKWWMTNYPSDEDFMNSPMPGPMVGSSELLMRIILKITGYHTYPYDSRWAVFLSSTSPKFCWPPGVDKYIIL